MIISDSDNDSCTSTITSDNIENPENLEEEDDATSAESSIDVSNQTLDLDILDVPRISSKKPGEVEGLYVYKNVFNLIPKSVSGLKKLKFLKFFGNEVNLFPVGFDVGSLVSLEKVQVKISVPGLGGLDLSKMKGLKELEICKAPVRVSGLKLLKDIVVLERLTKLSVCYFSIRYLPPEIGCLTCLEYLDLSHNKMKYLPTEIAKLTALITLKVANNKLIQLPSALSSLQRLENLDLSNNRLTSLVPLELDMMLNLQNLNLQNNKLSSFLQIPVWISCDLAGNDEDMANGEYLSSYVEMDVLESTVTDLHDDSANGSIVHSSTHSTAASSSRYIPATKIKKAWKRDCTAQQKAREKHLNISRNRKSEDSAHVSTQTATRKCESGNDAVSSESIVTDSTVDAVYEQVDAISGERVEGKNANADSTENGVSSKPSDASKKRKRRSKRGLGKCERDHDISKRDLDASKVDLDNRDFKRLCRPTGRDLDMSSKYSTTSRCSIDEYLPDGFYDAGRDRPFLPLDSYEKSLHLASREIILMDRRRDEELDAVILCAEALVSHLSQMCAPNKKKEDIILDNLQIASLLAQFVSDHFGGSDKSSMVDRARKSVFGSNYAKPFVCTCPTGNDQNIVRSAQQSISFAEDAALSSMCEKSLQLIKARRNSIIVPIGTLQFGVCRHRALLMKYLCDRMKPPVPCELVRGYLDFAPHAWNVIVVKRGNSEVRLIVDACRPHDIREETDPEYIYRYIPLSRINSDASPVVDYPFPSLSTRDRIKEAGSTTLIQCKLGSIEAAAKVRTLEMSGSSADEIRNFEYNCLGEVRLLSVLKHPCIVQILGHQISTQWLPSQDGTLEHRIMQSAIFMEHVKGGSLKHFLEKLARSGEKHVPVGLALQIGKDVAWALSELHSKDIIHRDLKSGNVLIDFSEESEETPVVKLCDFDRAVPLRSPLHTCCIGHMGIPTPDICVGTPRWMAPEVYRTIHDRHLYGLEVDIWSFGCLLLELLTLQLPYAGLPDAEIHELILMGKRPLLTDELETLSPAEDIVEVEPETEEYKEEKTLRFLIDIYLICTKEDPSDRPTAEELYEMFVDFSNSSSSQL